MKTAPNRPRILVTERMSASAMARLEAAGDVTLLNRPDEPTLLAAVADADALVVRTYTTVTRGVLDAARRLRVIGRAGVGLDNIDLHAARERSIPVVHTPAASTHAVADLAIGLILAVQRRIVECDRGVRQFEFHALRQRRPGFAELRHQTLAVIGMGRIGSQVARRAAMGFGARVIYNDIRAVGPFPFAVQGVSFEQALAAADVVTLHVPLTRRTRGMIDAAALRRMKRGAVLVNTSRGPVVDNLVLADALHRGIIAGAAIDVYNPEPPPPDHPLRTAPNCVLTPHIAARSPEGLAAMNDVVDDVIAVLQGRPPAWPAVIEDDE